MVGLPETNLPSLEDLAAFVDVQGSKYKMLVRWEPSQGAQFVVPRELGKH